MSENRVDQGPWEEQPSPKMDKTQALARLGQAIWEADQFVTFEEIRNYVTDVMGEIESDRP